MAPRGGRPPPPRWLAVGVALAALCCAGWPTTAVDAAQGGDKMFGDKCSSSEECGFDGSFCDDISKRCICKPELPITNHLNKCGIEAKVNESCFFNEQCEKVYFMAECRDGVCSCRFQRQPIFKPDGSVECVEVATTRTHPGRYVDPTMIGILVAMCLMFITICVVLRLFSKARWRDNRTIFNTPNPRLMNVSLLREHKLPHGERRGSRASARGPSRQPSVGSLRPSSPGSRRGSKGSSVASGASAGKSPPQLQPPQQQPNSTTSASATTPMLESVTVEVQEAKA